MTNQEAFDKMLSHLRSLSERSSNCSGSCVYNGAMCVIGVLMTEEEQNLYGDYEGSVGELLRDMREDGHTSKLHYLDGFMLYQMQRVHDDKACWSAEDGFNSVGEERANRVADHLNLSTPHLKLN
jgi:hypothetical protein